jgi:hypothetical protein
VTVLLVIAAALQPEPTHATNWGSSGSPGYSPNPNWNGVWFMPAGDAIFNVGSFAASTTTQNALATHISWLNIWGGVSASYVTYCSSENACVVEADYGNNGYGGWNQCIGAVAGSHPNQTCTRAYVQLNLNSTFSFLGRRSLVCHELGHSLGLRHTTSTSSCMYVPPSAQNIPETYNTHDINHLNTRY